MKKPRNTRLTPQDKRCIALAISYIDRHFINRLSPEQVSIEVNLSKQKLQAGIFQATGYSLHQYLRRVRVEKAKGMLDGTNDPVKAIAFATGFKRSSHFIETFKELTDMTPSQYRIRDAAEK